MIVVVATTVFRAGVVRLELIEAVFYIVNAFALAQFVAFVARQQTVLAETLRELVLAGAAGLLLAAEMGGVDAHAEG